MENPESKLTALQFAILDGMADDYEDLEQLYLSANREFSEEEQQNIWFPRMLVQVRFPLRDLIDEIGSMLSEGYIKVKYSSDDRGSPFDEQGVPDLAALHHYWFGATEKGTRAWKAHLAHEASEP
jgi:hypothetical protein